jgi:hypothetical protein
MWSRRPAPRDGLMTRPGSASATTRRYGTTAGPGGRRAASWLRAFHARCAGHPTGCGHAPRGPVDPPELDHRRPTDVLRDAAGVRCSYRARSIGENRTTEVQLGSTSPSPGRWRRNRCPGRTPPAGAACVHCSCTTGPPLSPLPTAAAFGASLPFHHVVRPVWGAATVPLLPPLRCRLGSQVTSCPRAGHQCSSRGWWTSSSMVARERCVIRTTAQNPDDSGEIWASSYLYRRGITLRTGPGGTMRRHDTKGCAACDE